MKNGNARWRQFSIVCLAGWFVLAGTGNAAPRYEYEYEEDPPESTMIQPADDLQALGEVATQQSLVIMLAMSTPWCEYCEALEQQVIEPMMRNGDFRGRALVRKIMVDDTTQLEDFSGEPVSTTQFARSRKVDLYPTLLFVNAEGNELTRRIVGITVLEFAADEIDRALRRASGQLAMTGR